MNPSLDIKEATTRMNRRGTDKIQWTGTDKIVEWRYLTASAALHWDGSSNLNFDADPNKTICFRKVTVDGRSMFSNWW